MRYFLRLLLIISFFQLLLAAGEIKDVNFTTKKKVVTLENIIEKSKATEEKILSSKNLDFDKIYEHGYSLRNYYLFEENVLFMQKILNRSIELYGVDSFETKIAYLNLAYAYLYTSDKNSAKIIYELAEDTKENMPYEKNVILGIKILNIKANYELVLKNFNKSLIYSSKALALMKKYNLNVNIGYMRILHSKSLAEYHLGNYDKALNLIMESSKIGEENNIILDFSELGEVQSNLALILIKQKKYKQAYSQVMSALKTIKDSGDSDLPITIELLDIFNATLIFTNGLSSISSNAQAALKIQQKIGYKNNDTIVSLYMFSGLAEKKLGNYKKAEEFYKKALLILEEISLTDNEKKAIRNKIDSSLNEIKKVIMKHRG